MLRFFENLVDPYVAYVEKNAPPRRLLPFLLDYARPFRAVFIATMALKMCVAAVEVGLIWYVGRLVDLLSSGTPADVLRVNGLEFLLAALAVLLILPGLNLFGLVYLAASR